MVETEARSWPGRSAYHDRFGNLPRSGARRNAVVRLRGSRRARSPNCKFPERPCGGVTSWNYGEGVWHALRDRSRSGRVWIAPCAGSKRISRSMRGSSSERTAKRKGSDSQALANSSER